MSKNSHDYQTIPFPKTRHFLVDIVALGKRKHLIHGLLEMDVTDARRRMRELRERTGAAPSFTGFLIRCVAKAVDENKIMHAYRDRGDQLVLFDDVDVSTIVEVEANGRRFPLGHIIRAANKRPLQAIHDEIRHLQRGEEKVADALPGGLLRSFLLSLPAFLRRMLYRASVKRPQGMKKNAGTVLVTAVGMFGKGAGWGIPISMHTLAVTLGGIAEKPGVVDGRMEIREFLSVTITVDHDIVDGAPAARFAQRLRELVEGGHSLDNEWARAAKVGTEVRPVRSL